MQPVCCVWKGFFPCLAILGASNSEDLPECALVEGRTGHRDIKNEDRTDYVYENKDEQDKMYVYHHDLFPENERILRNSS
jgi:hypothetical protein